jgi:hypothetical protein
MSKEDTPHLMSGQPGTAQADKADATYRNSPHTFAAATGADGAVTLTVQQNYTGRRQWFRFEQDQWQALTATEPEPADAERAAVRDAITAWENGDEGARDRLNAIFASWAANSLPIPMQNRQEIADSIAMTITAGITPYLEAAVLRLAAVARTYQDPAS